MIMTAYFRKRMRFAVLFLTLSLLLAACSNDDSYRAIPDEVQGWRPVYYDNSQSLSERIYSDTPRQMQVNGKIYIYKHFLFVNESGKGVHVFDNSNPSSPVPFSYIHIPYNYDIAIRDTVLYADTYAGLVAISIADLPAVRLISFILNSSLVPPLPPGDVGNNGRWWSGRVYFECIDPSKGTVVDWERAELRKPKCYQSWQF